MSLTKQRIKNHLNNSIPKHEITGIIRLTYQREIQTINKKIIIKENIIKQAIRHEEQTSKWKLNIKEKIKTWRPTIKQRYKKRRANMKDNTKPHNYN